VIGIGTTRTTNITRHEHIVRTPVLADELLEVMDIMTRQKAKGPGESDELTVTVEEDKIVVYYEVRRDLAQPVMRHAGVAPEPTDTIDPDNGLY
jgi:hypothetical protein